ncbi:3-oxoacyl-ACP synthase [Lentzea guizhouensis]|uniref:3-oxoacyl-ACP synthase n=1 Tax=Lentzea guizhouensis TaxID=1586287 RepID=A0A1B2HPU5_9PSEU|nr:beta-ketoacyl synthase N-terminal-like domain-containing protein [Lentzea guizhouensis]ANZ39739.1 3-oxoacyl-ACP synthase [Lentzea guizhouensis]
MSHDIAGIGAITSVGRDADEVFEALCSGRTGLSELRAFDHAKFRARGAFEIDDRLTPGVDEPGRATRWLVDVIAQAVKDAGIGEDLTDVPIIVGTGLRELRSAELWWRDGAVFEAADLDFGPALRRRFGALTSYTFANACSASLHAVALGADLVDSGQADTVVVAGVDSITESMNGLLDRVNLEPPDRVRPFDRARKGALMGEGAAAVVLRRASPSAHGRLRAVSLNCDAKHVTAPDPRGIADAIENAHARAGVVPGDVDLVLLHGTGTLLNDEAEARAMAAVFGEEVGRPHVAAIKGMTGHTSGSAGLLGLVVAVKGMAHGRVPPAVGLTNPIEAAQDFRFAHEVVHDPDLRVAQVNAFGFGGVNAVAVVERATS